MINGYVKPGFEAVQEAFEANFAEGNELGAGFAAVQDGEILVNLTGGYMDRKKEKLWTENTLVPVFSTTKGIAALVAAYVIAGRPNTSFDTLVADFWPEFAVEGKNHLSIAHVLSHQGGLSGLTEEFDPALWLESSAIGSLLAAAKPLWSPVPDGTSGYHPLTWGYLVQEIVTRLSEKSVGMVLAEAFTGTAAGATDIDFWLGTPDSEHDRCAEMQRPRELADLGPMNEFKKAAFMTKWAAPNRGGADWKRVEIPSANGHGTALSTAQLYGMYAQDGKLGDHQLIDAGTFADLTKRRTLGPDRVLPFEIEFAAGVMRNNAGYYGPNPNAYGHSGWGGSAALADPDLGLSAAYVMNRQSNSLQGDPRSQRLFKALYDCL